MKTEVIPAWGMASVFVSWLVYFRLRLLRFLLWVFALVLVLRFARFFNVNDRQLAVNASQCFFGLLCSLCSLMLCGYGAQWSLMVLPQHQGAASLALG